MERSAGDFTTRTVSNYQTILRYTTFIRPARVDAPPLACDYSWPNHYYGGDNRGFDATGNSFRTRWDRVITWDGSLPDESRTYVGTTHVYDQSGNLVDQRTAPPNFTVGSGMGGEDLRMWDANFDVGDPFCHVGSIASDFSAWIYRSGSYSVSGDHRSVPDHEIYVKHTNTGWATVYQRQMESLNCLFEFACGRSSILGDGVV